MPSLPCVSLWGPASGAASPETGGQDPRRERVGEEERRRERGCRTEMGDPFGPYILSSPERVAIISRQWPTDRSASQKDRGPIIAATHRPPRFGRSSIAGLFSIPSPPPRLSFLSFFSPPGEFLLLRERGRGRVKID